MEKNNITDYVYDTENGFYSILRRVYEDSFKRINERLGFEISNDDLTLLFEYCCNEVPAVIYMDMIDDDFKEVMKYINISRAICDIELFNEADQLKLTSEMKKVLRRNHGSIISCLDDLRYVIHDIESEITEDYDSLLDNPFVLFNEVYHGINLLAFVEYRKSWGLDYKLGHRDIKAVSEPEMDFMLEHCKPTNINKKALAKCLYEFICKSGSNLYTANRRANTDEQKEYMQWLLVYQQRNYEHILKLLLGLVEE